MLLSRELLRLRLFFLGVHFQIYLQLKNFHVAKYELFKQEILHSKKNNIFKFIFKRINFKEF